MILIKEWGNTRHQNVQNDTGRPQIASLRISLLQYNFGSHVVNSSAECQHGFEFFIFKTHQQESLTFVVIKALGQSKVNKFNF